VSDVPQTRYAHSGDLSIAYQVYGEGPLDVVISAGWISHLDLHWEQPLLAHYLRRPASFARVIVYDKRGSGLSDRVPGVPTLEEGMDDLRAVMDDAGVERAALIGHFDSGAVFTLFAATYPERTSALIIVGGYAKGSQDETFPIGPDPLVYEALAQTFEGGGVWGQGESVPLIAPTRTNDAAFREWWARFERAATSPSAAAALFRMVSELDVRDLLPSIQVPTLVVHQDQHPLLDVANARYLAEQIPGAKLAIVPSIDVLPYLPDGGDEVMDEIEEFLTGERAAPVVDRVLATVLFTDIVGSTTRASELGDRAWRELLDRHDDVVRRQLGRFRGAEVKTIGDGFLATFDGPGRAIQCGLAIRDNLQPLGIEVRAGLHTGEVERRGDDLGGIAVHIGARISALAAPGEVLVSSTVKDLVVGSGTAFDDRGAHHLKGVPDEWRLYAVEA
jgi:class 3 adenylate cyclase/pimeloyl-ACP methyl ester carboxylesterase